MSLAISLPRSISAQASASSLFIEAGRISFFTCFQRPRKGSPLVELTKHEWGTGWSLIAGPLLVEISLA